MSINNARLLNLIRRLKRRVYLLLYKYYKVETNTIFFYPHPNCLVDKYDVIRYHSDNALCLINYLLRQGGFNNYKLYVATYNDTLISQYESYCRDLNPDILVSFVSVDNPQIVKTASKCELYFTDTTSPLTVFKRKSTQTVVDLGYFVPFKNIYINDKDVRNKAFKANAVFDYALTTADMPARTISLSFGIPLENVLTLGLCRNDIFYDDCSAIKVQLENKLKRTINKIIVYVPTWRNYEYRGEAKNTVFNRDLFGYDAIYTEVINRMLQEHNSIIIAKLHPLQCNINVSESLRENILLYRDIEDVINCSLYQLLTVSDGMITDYTTTYWDYLNKDKPVVFNFYDFEKYNETRGFSYNPIDFFCAGPIVKNGDSLIKAISDILRGVDEYKEARNNIRVLFDCNCDGESTKRIVNYFLK